MDKDEFFKILEDVAIFNMENYLEDSEWTLQSSLSQIHKKEEKEFNFEDLNESEKSKGNRIEMNAIKYYHMNLDETSFYEKIKKENDERKSENAYKFAQSNFQNLDEYYDRKIQFFEKMINSNATYRNKYNKLNYQQNTPLEKYSLMTSFQDICPGLKPDSNWPVSLDDLLLKLSTVKIEEIFHQPFDVSGEFHNEGINFIKKYFNLLNEINQPDDEKKIYEEYLTKSIQALLVIKILEGNFTRLYQVLNLLKDLNKQNENVFDKIFKEVLNQILLKEKLKEMMNLYKENKSEVYPIMRNYSITDFFNISKNLLFASRHTFSTGSSITTDSKYLFLILSGINGGMFKIGTGNESTIKGKVYLYEKMNNFPQAEESSFQWVYLKGKLYLKSVPISSLTNLNKEFGYLTILNAENFKIVGKTKLLFPESVKHPLLKRKNENYILLTDGENLNVILLEPVIKENEQIIPNEENKSDDEEGINNFDYELSKSQFVNINNKDGFRKAKNLGKNPNEVQYPADIFQYMNLMMYTFTVDHTGSKTNREKEENIQKMSQINEIYEAFTNLFTRDECKKALILNNWNLSKTALYLADNEKEIKQPILISEVSCLLFQTKIEATLNKSNRSEFKIIKNSIFDTTQFDLLKWSINKDYVMAYKLKEGACVLFSRNQEDVKEFKYSYSERNNQMKENMYPQGFYLKDRDSYNYGLSSEDNFERRLIEDALLKEVWQAEDNNTTSRNLMPLKDIKDFIGFGSNQGTTNKTLLGFTDVKDMKDLTNKLGKDVLIKDYSNNFPKEKKYNMNPFLNENKDSSFNPFSHMGNQNSNFNKFSNYNDNSINNQISPNTNNTNQNIPSNFSQPYPDYNKKILVKERIKYSNNEEFVDFDRKKKKYVREDVKDELSKKFKSKQEKVPEIGGSIPIPKEKEEPQKIEEKILEDTVKGSFIKVLNCIQLSKYDNNFCYDHLNNIYYIVSNGSLNSISILVSSTFEEKSKILKNLINLEEEDNFDLFKTFDEDNINFIKFYNELLKFVLLINSKKPDLYWKYKNWNYYFTLLFENLNNRQKEYIYEGSFSNEYTYPLLTNNNQINSTNIKLLINKIEKSAELNEKFLRSQLPLELFENFKIEYFPSHQFYNKNIPKYLNPNSNNKNEEKSWTQWNNLNHIEFVKKDNEINSYNKLTELNDKFILLENSKSFYLSVDGEIETFCLLLNNLNEAYLIKDKEEIHNILIFVYLWFTNNLNLINLQNEKVLKEKILIKKLLTQILEINEHNLNNMVYRVIFSGWEFICSDLQTQLEYFYKIFNSLNEKQLKILFNYKHLPFDLETNILNLDFNSHSTNPLNILLKKLSYDNSLKLNNNFDKINLIKVLQFSVKESNNKIKIKAKPQHISINPNNLSFPFHLILLGFNLYKKSIQKEEIEEISDFEDEEEDKSAFFKYIDKSNFIDKSIPLSFFKNKLDSKKENFLNIKNINQFNQNLFLNNINNISDEELKKISEEFFNFLEDQILNHKNLQILNIMNDLFLLSQGEINENNSKNEENKYNQNNFNYMIRNLEFLQKIINQAESISFTNILPYANNVITSTFSQIKKIPIKLQEEIQEKFSNLINEISELKIFKTEETNILNKVQTLSSTGYQQEKEKSFEFNLGNEMVQIYEKIQYASSHSIVVEIELKTGKEKPFNYDLIVVSNEHSYNNMKFNTNNNFNNFGTCFLMKLHQNTTKKLFLSGDEIKIISPSELEFNKGNLGRRNFTKGQPNLKSNTNFSKSVLKIKCYPYDMSLIGCDKENVLNMKIGMRDWIEILKDLDYYNSCLNRNFIKSIDSKENEFENSVIGMSGNNTMMSEPIVKQGLNNYNKVEEEFQEIYNSKIYSSLNNYNNNEDKNIKNIFTNYLKNLNLFNDTIKTEIEVFLSYLDKIYKITNSELDENNLNDFSDLFDNTLSFKIITKLREIIREPNEYISMKMIPTFNQSQQLKSLWKIVEHIFIICLIYHLNMHKEIINTNYIFPKFHMEMIGKKLNNLLIWMSNRVKTMKDTFDNLKSYLIDIIDTNNNFLGNVKTLVIQKIKKEREEFNKIINEEEGLDSDKNKKEPYKKRNSLEDTKSKFVLKTPNFKKKANVKRLYQELPKKKREHSKSVYVHKESSNINEISIEELQTKSFKYIFENYNKYVYEFLSLDYYREMKNEIKEKIEADIKEAYFGNAEKLKNILEINGLLYIENNLQESLKNYTNFIFKSISSYYNLDDSLIPDEINSDKILKKLFSESPYYKMAFYILERLLFLLELNSLQEDKIHNEEDIINLKMSGSSHDLINLKEHPHKFHKEDFFLSYPQQNIIKSIFSFIYKSTNINELRLTMQRQYIRLRIREIGIKNYCKFLSMKEYEKGVNINNRNLSKLFLNNVGSLCYAVRKSLINGVETVSHLNLIKTEDLNLLLNYNFENFNDHLNLYSAGNNIKDLRILDHHINLTSEFTKSEEITMYRLKNLNLILSDIFIILKFLSENNNIILNLEYDIEKFILSSINFIFNDTENKESLIKLNKLKTEFSDNLRMILSKLVGLGITREKIPISELVIDALYQALDNAMQMNQVDQITNVLSVIYYISHSMKLNENQSDFTMTSLYKLSNKVLELITNSETYETVSLSCKIFKSLGKNSQNKMTNDSIYERLGRLFLFKNANPKDIQFSDTAKYFVFIQMNSPEIDYQFLINALYYWEEKYPTKLSLYNYREFSEFVNDKNKEREILELYGLINNPNISANININNSGQKIKMFNYFNQLKSKTTKMNLLEKIADERIANLRKAIEEGTKILNSKSESATNSKLSQENIDSIKDRIFQLKRQEAYQCRIKAHIKTAELIGETACTRGFVCLEPAMSREIAEELAEVIHKAYNRLLPHFKANIDETINLFNDDLIYPKMPEKEQLLPGCTNTLKETTQNFMNVSLFEESVYERFDSTLKSFTDSVKKLAVATNYQEEKRTKIGFYNNNYLLGYNYNLISLLNFNDSSNKRIIESTCISGTSVSMIIEEMLNLIYSTFDCDSYIKEELHKINKDDWIRNEESSKMKIVGVLLVISGYYNILRNNSKAIFKQNHDDVCKILSGGNKTGKSHSHVIFLKEKTVKIEKVMNKDLEKMKLNSYLINSIKFLDLVNCLINSFEIYLENKENLLNKIVLHLVLKILSEKKLDNEEVFNLLENNNENNYKIGKFVEILRLISSETLWLEKEDSFWEMEFIDSFERIYNRMDVNAEKIYAPVFDISDLASQKAQFHPIISDNAVNSDLITKYQLPESNYIKYLPKISDLSKCTTALKNIQNFDRYLVGEIYQYNAKQWREDDFLNAFYQIRNYLSIGDIPNAYADLNQILDGAKIPAYMFPPKEHIDTKEISKEECYPSNYYMAKLSSKFIRESGIRSLVKQGGIMINEIPVLMLLHDNTINQALVLYNDVEYGKLYTFWTPIDSLKFLEHQIKIPSNSFKMSELLKEFKYLEKRLRILYSKNVLSNVMKLLANRKKINNMDDLLFFLNISGYKTFRLNPTSGPFYHFKNYINVRLNKSENSEKLAKITDGHHFNLNEVLSSVSQIERNSSILSAISNNNSYDLNLEKVVSGLKIGNSTASELIIQWCMNNWENIDKTFVKIKANLFHEFNINYNENLRSKNVFHMGNFNHKMLALHELCEIDINQFAGIVLTFEKEAILGPHAKISFYSDPYGENLIQEIISIKTTKSNLESVVFNYPKVWMYYTPGTRAFSIFEWFLQSRDSNLPCSIVFIPHNWPNLIFLTDYCTSSLFNQINKDSLKVFENLIRRLLVHCTNLSLPADLQRRIFNLTNRAILKVSKYLSILENEKKIKLSELSISQKFNIIGIDEFTVTQLINNINNFNNINNKDTQDKSLSSNYIVEGVEIILSILSVIKESYHSLDHYLKNTFDYTLPVWIEAVIKLGQFLNFLQGTSNLEGILMKEIYDQLNISSQFEKLISIQNIPDDIDDSIILAEIKNLLLIHKAKIVDVNKDIQILKDTLNNTKTLFILTDGFLIEDLKESTEEIKSEPQEDPFWECFYCHMENDKENTFCIFCDKNKKIKPKEVKKEKSKSSLIKIDSYIKNVSDRMNSLIDALKTSNILTEYEIKEEIIKEVLMKTVVVENIPDVIENVNYVIQSFEEQLDNLFVEHEPVIKTEIHNLITKKRNELIIIHGEDIKKKNLNGLLNEFFRLRIKEYIQEEDYIKDKYRNLEANTNLRKYIEKELEVLKSIIFDKNEEKINYVKFYEVLQNNGVDFWLENDILDSQSRNNEININLMEKLRELVDLKICKEKNLSLILPALDLRFVPTNFESINHFSMNLLENYYQEIKNIPLCVIRFYWTIIKYFNNCLVAALPFIKPPDAYVPIREVGNSEEEGYTRIAFPKTISAFLSSARGITFSVTKLNLIKEVISNTEFNEEEVQIPLFKFERLNIQANLDKNLINKSNKIQSNDNLNGIMMYHNANNSFRRLEEEFQKETVDNTEITNDESIFLQAYEQAKDVDPAFFRSKKVPGDPHIGFKVEFKGEFVQGIGGPYRQFFSDVSAELQDKEYKNKKSLHLLIPTTNTLEQKGEFKDRWTLNPSRYSNTDLNLYEFLGILMGICIRTGVHLTLDICSLIWKKIIGEPITLEDIKQFDEGLYNRIIYFTDDSLTEEMLENEEDNYSTRLTDGSLYELVPEGADKRITYQDRFKYLELLIKARVCESDSQIDALKKGLCKIIPESLLKLLTHRELERLICGVKKVDIDLLRTNTKLSQDLNESTFKVIWLWEILNEFTEEEKIKFVKFCWAQERLPSTQEEFHKLQVVFTIKSYIDKNRKDVFPRADTCFFSIELPEYSAKDVMKRMILQAITLDNVTINGDKVVLDNVRGGLDYGGGYRRDYLADDDYDSDAYR